MRTIAVRKALSALRNRRNGKRINSFPITMGSIYELDNEYDEDVISVKKLMAALDRNLADSDIPVLAQMLKMDELLLRKALSGLNHVDVVKW